MVVINSATKEIVCKIVYYGPALGGKTTNLRFIHKMLPEGHKGELISLATQQDRTLFFDFLSLDLGKIQGFTTKFALYTVPGQVFYNATRRIVLRGVDGIVFVADSQSQRLEENIDSLENMAENLAYYGYDLEEIPWVIQYNKRDLSDILPVEVLQRKLNFLGVPYFESIAITGQGVKDTLKGISSLVLSKIEKMCEQKDVEDLAINSDGKAQVFLGGAKDSPTLAGENVLKTSTTTQIKTQSQPQTGEEKFQKAPLARIKIRQLCNLYWYSLRVGKGKVELDSITTPEGIREYVLNVNCKIIKFITHHYTKSVKFERRIALMIDGREEQYFLFRENPENQTPPTSQDTIIWLKDSGPTSPIYTKFKTRLGTFYLVPERDRIFFKYLV